MDATQAVMSPVGGKDGAQALKDWLLRNGRRLLGLEAKLVVGVLALGWLSGAGCVGCTWLTADIGPRVHITLDRKR